MDNYVIVFLKYYQHPAMLIEATPTARYRKVIEISLWSGKTLTLKSHDHESASEF